MDMYNDSVFVGILKPGLPGPRFARAGAVNSPGLKPRVNGGIYDLHWPLANGDLVSLHRPGLRWF
jgi:hypothetical protein